MYIVAHICCPLDQIDNQLEKFGGTIKGNIMKTEEKSV